MVPSGSNVTFREQSAWIIGCCACQHSTVALYRPPELPSPGPEPMQVDSTRIPLSERQRRITQGLWLYCASKGHVIAECPIRPPRALVSTVQPENTLFRQPKLSYCFVISLLHCLPFSTLGQLGTSSQPCWASSLTSRKSPSHRN